MSLTTFYYDLIRQNTFLVTGGAGFIGSHLVEFLLSHQAHRVVVLDNLSTGSLQNIQSFLGYPNFTFIKGDICDLATCQQAFDGVDYVLHQAALNSVPRSLKDPHATHTVNVTGFMNLMTAMINAPTQVKKMVYASSSSVYGNSRNNIKQEQDKGEVLSPYAASKLINEIYADLFSRTHQLDILGLRYFNVFGPRQNTEGLYPPVIPHFIQSILNNQPAIIHGTGEQTRDFTYIDNVIQANIKALFTKTQSNTLKTINIACNQSVSVNTLWKNINYFCQKNIQPVYAQTRTGDIENSKADISEAKNILNYMPEVLFEEGLKRTIVWYRDRDLARYTQLPINA